MTTDLFAVVEESYVGLDESSTTLHADRNEAMEVAARENRDADTAGVPVVFRVFALTEIQETR